MHTSSVDIMIKNHYSQTSKLLTSICTSCTTYVTLTFTLLTLKSNNCI